MSVADALLAVCLLSALSTVAAQTCGSFCQQCTAGDDVCSRCQDGYTLMSASCDCKNDIKCAGCQCVVQSSGGQSTTRIIIIALVSTVIIISLGLLFLYLYEAKKTGPGPSFSEVARRIQETEALSVHHLRREERRTNQINMDDNQHQPPPLDQIDLRFNSSHSGGSDTWRNLIVPTVRLENP